MLAGALLLAGCGSNDEPAPGAATEGEQRALSDAAEMLDARPAATPIAAASATPTASPSGD